MCFEGYGDSWTAYEEERGIEMYTTTETPNGPYKFQSQKCSAWRWIGQSNGMNMEIKTGVEYNVSTGYHIFDRQGKSIRGCDDCG